MKQFMVVKLAELGHTLQVVPFGGLMPQREAEAFVQQARHAEPNSVFVVQEVGVA